MTEEIEFRVAQLADVSFPNRTLELIVMPYETETTIAERGRLFTEIVSRGAFDGIESRNARVRVNRDHDVTRTVGRAVTFHPSRDEGLVAELRIANTDLGTETLSLADEGCLDASAGFGLLRKNGRTGPVVPNAETWETKDRRRLNHLYLAHIALTPDPAYETAQVLAVRSEALSETPTGTPVATPNLDVLELERWRQELAVLDARYSCG